MSKSKSEVLKELKELYSELDEKCKDMIMLQMSFEVSGIYDTDEYPTVDADPGYELAARITNVYFKLKFLVKKLIEFLENE